MFFFTFLIGACVAIQSGILKPVDQKTAAVSLIQTAKTDPHALIQMLQGADKDKLQKILNLLVELRDEAIAEQGRLTKYVADVRALYAREQKEEKRLEGVEISKKVHLDQAISAFNKANGVYTETKKEHDEGAPRLNTEIDVFNKVLRILRNLTNNQPQEKELLALGASAEGLAYQNMIDNLKADPEKLNKVISIVDNLLTQSEGELKLLVDTMNDAHSVRQQKNAIRGTAFGAWKAASALLNAQKMRVSQVKGIVEAAQKEYNTQYPVAAGEQKTLEEVIKILTSMLKEAQD